MVWEVEIQTPPFSSNFPTAKTWFSSRIAIWWKLQTPILVSTTRDTATPGKSVQDHVFMWMKFCGRMMACGLKLELLALRRLHRPPQNQRFACLINLVYSCVCMCLVSPCLVLPGFICGIAWIICLYMVSIQGSHPGSHLNIKTVFPMYGIPMLKIRRSRDRLIFNMRTPILVRQYLYIETSPRLHDMGSCWDGTVIVYGVGIFLLCCIR